jgi:hypothetical protein
MNDLHPLTFSSTAKPTWFDAWPVELYDHMITFLDPDSIRNLTLTCQSVRQFTLRSLHQHEIGRIHRFAKTIASLFPSLKRPLSNVRPQIQGQSLLQVKCHTLEFASQIFYVCSQLDVSDSTKIDHIPLPKSLSPFPFSNRFAEIIKVHMIARSALLSKAEGQNLVPYVKRLLELGDTLSALNLAREVKTGPLKGELAILLSKNLKAPLYIQPHIDYVLSVEDDQAEQKNQSLINICLHIASFGLRPLSRAVAHKLRLPACQTFNQLVQIHAQAHDFDEALALCESIQDVSLRGLAQLSICEHLAICGQSEKALSVAEGIVDPLSKNGAIGHMGQVFLKNGDLAGVMALFSKMTPSIPKDELLMQLSKTFLQAHQMLDARSMAVQIQDSSTKDDAICQIIEYLLAQNLPNEAMGLLADLGNISTKHRHTKAICIAQSDHLPVPALLEMIAVIHEPREYDTLCLTIAQALICHGRYDEALEMADVVQCPEEYANEFSSLSCKFGLRLQFEKASQIALRLPEGRAKNKCLIFLCEQQALAGLFDQAFLSIGSIPFEKEKGIARAAVEKIQRGEKKSRNLFV